MAFSGDDGGSHALKILVIRHAGGILIAGETNIAAEWYPTNPPLYPRAIAPGQDRAAKPDSKAINGDTTRLGHQKVSQLVNRYHQRQHRQKRDHIDQRNLDKLNHCGSIS